MTPGCHYEFYFSFKYVIFMPIYPSYILYFLHTYIHRYIHKYKHFTVFLLYIATYFIYLYMHYRRLNDKLFSRYECDPHTNIKKSQIFYLTFQLMTKPTRLKRRIKTHMHTQGIRNNEINVLTDLYTYM